MVVCGGARFWSHGNIAMVLLRLIIARHGRTLLPEQG